MVGADFGEASVFGQEAITGVNGIGAAGCGGGQDVGNIEVALATGGFSHADGFIGQLHMQCVLVDRAVHSHGGDAQFPAGAKDPEGDLAPVGDQQFADGHPPRLS